MFPVFSIISHSCLPNANPVLLQKNQLALEAKLDIVKGEEITISYISIMQVSTWAQLFTSLKADLHQDIKGGFTLSSRWCLNGTFL